tara:strand:- start:516 stop:875 length:360 start_codon:yes stop_codon:yes gene_type:complete
MGTFIKSYVLLLVSLSLPLCATASSTEANNELPFSAAETVSADDLENARGREGLDIDTLNKMNVQATLTDNTANNNVTGSNIIDTGAFAGSGGMFSVIQNSGNNVVIQDSTIVNVTIVP